MGGAIGTGNANPVAEFNKHTDADAAAYVFESNIPIYMVPLEVTRTACVNETLIRDVRSIGSNLSTCLIEFLLFYDSTIKSIFSLAAARHDPCAVAFVIDPDMLEYRLMRVDVETSSSLSYGQTVCDVFNLSPKKANVHVCMSMNVPKFWDMMLDSVKKCDKISPANRRL
jgi:inosine-uridine nucleoside N-ribohydrolase